MDLENVLYNRVIFCKFADELTGEVTSENSSGIAFGPGPIASDVNSGVVTWLLRRSVIFIYNPGRRRGGPGRAGMLLRTSDVFARVLIGGDQ